jgi:hypothetical protein
MKMSTANSAGTEEIKIQFEGNETVFTLSCTDGHVLINASEPDAAGRKGVIYGLKSTPVNFVENDIKVPVVSFKEASAKKFEAPKFYLKCLTASMAVVYFISRVFIHHSI